VRTLSEIRRFFAQNKTPIYFFNTTPFNLLGAERWIGGLQFINTMDSFDQQHHRALVPAGAAGQQVSGVEAANQYLLDHPSVGRFVQPGGKALFLMFDEQNEKSARALGLDTCLPAASFRNQLDSKVVTTELANRAGVASVPNVLGKIESYGELRRAASALGPDLVVQLPHGDSGQTTFFVSDERDYMRYAARIAAQPVVKVMRRIRCRQLTIEACVTGRFTLVGPLQTELVGFPELTPFGGGWCGNEIFSAADSTFLTADLRQQAHRATLALGEELRRVGYRGCFGLDFLLDQDTGSLYLGEMNPRITGATPLTSQVMLESGGIPLLLFHLLEWFGQDLDPRGELDADVFNEQWLRAEHVGSWSHLIMEHIGSAPALVHAAPRSGIWKMQADGTVRFSHCSFSSDDVTNESEAFFLRTVNPGQLQVEGASLGRIVLRGRLLTDACRLNERAQAWIRGFRAHFQLQEVVEQIGVLA
jgi:hypothetical protein